MFELLALIIGLFSTPMTDAVTAESMVKVAEEVSAQEMYDYLGTINDGKVVTVDDDMCLSILDTLTPIIWESMGLGEAGILSSVDAFKNGITYHFDNGTVTSFDFEELLKMLE